MNIGVGTGDVVVADTVYVVVGVGIVTTHVCLV